MHGFEHRGLFVPSGAFTRTGRFGRMFPALPPLAEFRPGPAALGAIDGPMDGGAGAPTDPAQLAQNNPRIRAGYTFLGQFIDHDLTLDVTSVLERQIDPEATHNFRTPAFELDSLYGLGPSVQPYLYDGAGEKLLHAGHDLARNADGRALIGDPRNDENLIVSQLHLLFLKFHNAVVDKVVKPAGLAGGAAFREAQRIVRWHYQWIVLHEFLPRLVGRRRVRRLLAEKPFRYHDDAFMPVEFSVAAYRFGHSQTRPGYLINRNGGPNGSPFAAVLFPPPQDQDAESLRGFRPVPQNHAVDWSAFFGPDGQGGAQPSKKVDIKLSSPMLHLPVGVVPADDPRRSLATRNLQRGIDAGLPSGQDVAAMLAPSVARLTEAQIWKDVPGGGGPAPLWFYVLREAEVNAKGLRLANAGAEIVGRTFVALLDADPACFLNRDIGWRPTLPGARAGEFTMTDLANFTLGTAMPGEVVAALVDV